MILLWLIANVDITYFHCRLFQKDHSKVDKSIEVKKSVKSSMRSMASLYLTFREEMEKNGKTCASVETLFNREHFEFLTDAVCQMAEKDDDITYGMKNNLQYLLVSYASILRSTILTQPGNENDAI